VIGYPAIFDISVSTGWTCIPDKLTADAICSRLQKDFTVETFAIVAAMFKVEMRCFD